MEKTQHTSDQHCKQDPSINSNSKYNIYMKQAHDNNNREK